MRYIVTFGGVFIAIAVILYFISPFAPLLLLLSLVIQVPIILFIVRYTTDTSYAQRVDQREQQFEEDGNAAAWLKEEEQEANSIGFKYWSKKGRYQNMLTRAELLHRLGRSDEAAALAADIENAKLPPHAATRHKELLQTLNDGETAQP